MTIYYSASFGETYFGFETKSDLRSKKETPFLLEMSQKRRLY